MEISVIEELPTDSYLKFNKDQLYNVRKLFNLEKPGRLKEAIELIRNWINKQEYFNKKDFTDGYLEILLISCKGSVERAKSCLDKLCTFRTIWPHFFTETDIQTCWKGTKTFNNVMLPTVTEENYRVNLLKIHSNVPLEPNFLLNFLEYMIIVAEYMKCHDYINGFVMIIDYQNVNLLDLLAIISPTQLEQILRIFIEGFGGRIKGIHIITTSMMSDAVVSLLKQAFSKKIGNRIHVHRNTETIFEHIPRKILPAEYGGDAGPLSEIQENFITALSTKEHIEYMKECQNCTIDLSKKPKDSSNDEYIAMSGSFRTLSVD